MPIVEIQGVGRVQFPDGMTPEQMNQAIEQEILPKQVQPSPVTAMNRVNAAASGFNAGVAGIVGIPIDTIQNVIDLGKSGAGSIYSAVTGNAPPQSLEVGSREGIIGSGAWLRKQLNKIGGAAQLPRPDDTASRYLYAGGQGAAGAMLGPSTGVSMVPSLTTNVAGALSSQAAAEKGYGPGGQILAGMAGGAAANSLRTVVAEGVKRSFRGGEEGRQRVEQNIQSFEDSGTTPTAGQATQNRRLQSAESMMSRAPGGAGVMSRKAEVQAAEIGAGLERQANSLAPRASAEQAGRAIERGIRGEGGFIENFKAKQSQLYDQLDKYVDPQAGVEMNNTVKALSDLNAKITGAERTSKFFQNSKMMNIEDALNKDLEASQTSTLPADLQQLLVDGGGTLPYEAVKKLRTLVGNEMADSSILSDVPRSKWKALYGALSSDMESAAKDAGPEATSAWNRANNYTRAGMKRLETIDHVVEKNGGPEAVFGAATSGTKEGATTLRAVMQSLPTEGQKTLTATVLRRLGRALPGKQNDLGEKFSTETFLTNWNSMSPQAKAALFDRYGPGFRQNMDQVAKVAANLREGSKVFQNPSGTAQASIQYTTAGAAVMAILTGNVGTAAGIGAAVGGSNLASRLLVNPSFVKWLATTTKAPPQALPSLAVQLAQNGNTDEQEFARLLQEQAAQQP